MPAIWSHAALPVFPFLRLVYADMTLDVSSPVQLYGLLSPVLRPCGSMAAAPLLTPTGASVRWRFLLAACTAVMVCVNSAGVGYCRSCGGMRVHAVADQRGKRRTNGTPHEVTLVGITVRAVFVRHQLRARRADDAAWSKTQAEPVLNLGQNATTKQVVALNPAPLTDEKTSVI